VHVSRLQAPPAAVSECFSANLHPKSIVQGILLMQLGNALTCPKNSGPILSIFGLLFGPKFTDKWYNIDVRIVINAGRLVPRVTNWLPEFDGIPFSALGPIQGHKVQHLLVTWGRLKKSFLYSALTPSIKPLGDDFNFCTNRNA
jgi:hypothetical protein